MLPVFLLSLAFAGDFVRLERGSEVFHDPAGSAVGQVDYSAVVRVTNEQGDWLQVQTLQREGEPTGCGPWRDKGFDLVFWVKTDALAPVLTTPMDDRHPDGSGYLLRPGHRVERTEGRWVAVLGRPLQDLQVAVAEADVARRFNAGPPLELGRMLPLGNTPLRFFGAPLQTGPDNLLTIAAVEGERATMHVQCSTFTAIREVSEAKGGRGALIGAVASSDTIDAGTTLRWPTGEVAGTTTADITLHFLDTIQTRGGACVDGRSGLRLCWGDPTVPWPLLAAQLDERPPPLPALPPKPKEPRVMGRYAMADVQSAIAPRQARLDACGSGPAVLQWTLDAKGRPASILVLESAMDAEANACLRKEAARLRFPRPESTVVVTWPVNQPAP